MIQCVYALEEFPTEVTKTIFLLGPTPRSNEVQSWRNEMLDQLDQQGFDGHVFIPEARNGQFSGDYLHQVNWEIDACRRADILLFWIPRNMRDMPGLTTNVEFGYWIQSGKCLLGYPPDAEKVRYLKALADHHNTEAFESIEAIAREAAQRLSDGALRKAGECEVPLFIWNHDTFQAWYGLQLEAGNQLRKFNVRFCHFVNKNMLLSWIADVAVYVQTEGRIKSNEYVFARKSTVHCVLHYPGETILDTQLVLVKEFRSPVMNDSGFVYELVGGSSFKKQSPLESIKSEIQEEIGVQIDPERLKPVLLRQSVAATVAFTSELFSYELSLEEWESLNDSKNEVFGVIQDSEQTYIEITTFKELLNNRNIDWTTVGMCTQVLQV